MNHLVSLLLFHSHWMSLWTKQDIRGRHLGIWQTLINMFSPFLKPKQPTDQSGKINTLTMKVIVSCSPIDLAAASQIHHFIHSSALTDLRLHGPWQKMLAISRDKDTQHNYERWEYIIHSEGCNRSQTSRFGSWRFLSGGGLVDYADTLLSVCHHSLYPVSLPLLCQMKHKSIQLRCFWLMIWIISV